MPDLRMPDIDAARVARLIRQTAEAEILPRFEKLEKGDVTEKSPGDLVTVADVAAERRLTPELQALLPGSIVVGEEATAANPGALAALAEDRPVWLIDPIDGTANFAVGLPLFAVMVALIAGGTTYAGWIHEPLRNQTAAATLGGGAWCEERRLRVAAPPPLDSMSGSFGLRYGNRRLVRKIAGRAHRLGPSFHLRCVGLEYVAMAAGRSHFALYHRILPWDHAAGHLLHREAGGYAALLDGRPYSPLIAEGGLLLAPDEASWHELHNLLVA